VLCLKSKSDQLYLLYMQAEKYMALKDGNAYNDKADENKYIT
jgi:hypothetical protein